MRDLAAQTATPKRPFHFGAARDSYPRARYERFFPMSIHSTQLVRFPAIRRALGISQNRTILAMCHRHQIPIVKLSARTCALHSTDFDMLITRSTETL